MKLNIKLASIVLAIAAMFLPAAAIAQTLWYPSSNNLRPVSNSWGLQIPSLGVGGNPCLTVSATGVISAQACAGASSTAITSINSQTGPGITIAGTSNQVNITNTTNTITLSLPQSIDTGATFVAGLLKASTSGIFGSTGTPSSTLHVVGTFQTTATSTFGGNIVIGGDSIGDFVGTGLTLVGTTLQASLGTSVSPTELASADFGDFTCNGTSCSLDATYLTGNQTITLSGDITGSGATSITTAYNGVVPINKGGTATTTTPAALKLLVGNGTAYDLLTATAGSGITLSTSTTALTIAATLGTSVDLTSEITGILPVANGGTNLSAASDDNLMVGNGTTWQSKALTDCDDTGGQHLNYDTGTNAFSCGTTGDGTGGGGGSATTTINGVSGPTFTFSASTTGTDFTISTSTANVYFNFPTASASNRGLLSTADWSTFNSKQAGDSTLTALAAYNTNGILVQTAADTFAGRTITGTSNRLTVSNGDGVSGNPTLDISTSFVGQTAITTLGTITTGTWNAGVIPIAYGGTGTSTTPSALKFLVGNGNTYDLLTATAGSGITISTSTTALTIAASLGTSVDLTSEVTGILPLANGGTNSAITATNNRIAYSTASALALSGSDLTYNPSSALLSVGSSTISGVLTIPYASAPTLSATGSMAIATGSGSFSVNDGTAQRWINPTDCNTYAGLGTAGNQVFRTSPTPRIAFTTSTAVSAYAWNLTNGDTVTFNAFLTSNISSATSSMRKLFTSYQTVTATTTAATLTINGSSTIAANDGLVLDFSAASTTDFSVVICKRAAN